jgi:hypothetical protein
MKRYVGYLSGPIAQCSKEEMSNWRTYIKGSFTEYDYLDPVRRYYADADPRWKEIVELDKVDIARSDFILLNYFKNSNGTPMEAMLGHQMGKLVVIVNNSDIPSSHLSPWLKYHSTKIFDSWSEAFKFIDGYFEVSVPTLVRYDWMLPGLSMLPMPNEIREGKKPEFFGNDSTVGKDLVTDPYEVTGQRWADG